MDDDDNEFRQAFKGAMWILFFSMLTLAIGGWLIIHGKL